MPAINPLTHRLPDRLAAAVRRRFQEWDARDATRRLWDGDAALWTGRDEGRWLGWLRIADAMRRDLPALRRLGETAARDGFTHALLLGMGGSSLGPAVLKETFGALPGRPELLVLDSTDPAQVRALDGRTDPARTLHIVSSKSGTTLEPNILKAHFFERARRAIGADRAGGCFIAITDPGSHLEREAGRDRFRDVVHGVPSIGGRYSALSPFGMAPAAIMGLDVGRLLDGAHGMAQACGPGAPAADNPGVVLGVILGTLAGEGIDKLTILASPGLRALGAWLEQLIAESTGKEGRAIIPIDGERPGAPGVYGSDRLCVSLQPALAPEPIQEAAVAALEQAGLPVVRIAVGDRYDLGAEIFRWELATAVAGAILGINPFDQPDVEASKVKTRILTDACETGGTLPAETPLFEGGGMHLYADARNAAALAGGPGRPDDTARRRDPADWLRAHLDRLRPGDYAALLAYVPMNGRHEDRLQSARHRIRDAKRVATCLGFGPRFLHSTGQAYKGGPNTGVFLQVTCDDAVDLPVPGRGFTFGVVKAAQARGDFEVLAERGRRLLRVHLGADVEAGLAALDAAVERALA